MSETERMGFPSNIWLEILKTDILNEKDLCRIALVSRSLAQLVLEENALWKHKFEKRLV